MYSKYTGIQVCRRNPWKIRGLTYQRTRKDPNLFVLKMKTNFTLIFLEARGATVCLCASNRLWSHVFLRPSRRYPDRTYLSASEYVVTTYCDPDYRVAAKMFTLPYII